MLSPELEQLHTALTALKDHEHLACLIVEDEFGQRWSIRKAYAVGARTDDPGLVIRLAPIPPDTRRTL